MSRQLGEGKEKFCLTGSQCKKIAHFWKVCMISGIGDSIAPVAQVVAVFARPEVFCGGHHKRKNLGSPGKKPWEDPSIWSIWGRKTPLRRRRKSRAARRLTCGSLLLAGYGFSDATYAAISSI